MKKLISLLLTICLILSLGAFSVSAEDAKLDKSGWKIEASSMFGNSAQYAIDGNYHLLTQNDNLMAHVASLAMIHHYRAPGYSVSPYVLPDGCEVVEIVTGGEVFFPDETGRRLRYGPGTYHGGYRGAGL